MVLGEVATQHGVIGRSGSEDQWSDLIYNVHTAVKLRFVMKGLGPESAISGPVLADVVRLTVVEGMASVVAHAS